MLLYEKHKALLEAAVNAIAERKYFFAYPEMPKAYGDEAMEKGKIAFEQLIGQPFRMLLQPESADYLGEEKSPYTLKSLGISYPVYSVESMISTSQSAFKAWRKIGATERAGLLIESLEKMKSHFFDIAFATQHTTGQSWMMSFQASGPHAADRALEAIAMGYAEQIRFPEKTRWEKPMGKFSVKQDKTFNPVPRGIGLVIGCSTFPVWNTLPGLYANLITGNTVIVKPHPGSVLPIAICVAAIQQTLKENGIDPCVVQLAADVSDKPIALELAMHNAIKLIDYTGSTAFGNKIEALPRKITFTEKAGVNPVIIDSVQDLDQVLQNLAFSVSLYSGQMCTAPQNIFIPEKIKVGDADVDFDTVADKFRQAITDLVNNPKMGAGVLGAIQNEKTLERTKEVLKLGASVQLEATVVANADFVESRTVSPVLLQVASTDNHVYENELFGPVVIVIKTKNTNESVSLAKQMAEKHGAITCAAYTTNAAAMNFIADEMNEVFTPVTFNLTGPIWVNQHAAFSDLHVTGGNPAGNASFTDAAFVNKRFVWLGNRYSVN